MRMAVTNFDHTIKKYVDTTNQSFLLEYENIEKNKNFVNSGKFKTQLNQIKNTMLSSAKNVLDNEEAEEKLEKELNKLVQQYSNNYKKLLESHNQPSNEDVILQNEKNGAVDYDPINTEIGTDRYGQRLYSTTLNGQKYNKNISSYVATNNTFSMCDMVCTIDIATNAGKHIVATLGKLQTLSYSIFQNKTPVRVIGNMNARDYVFGQRTIAGSLVFAVFNRHWLHDIYDQLHDTTEMKNWHFISDEIPPFNITITFANEYGFDSRMALYGVRLVTEGQTMSINDIYIENTYEYYATDIEILDTLNAWQTSDKVGRRWRNTAGAIGNNGGSNAGTPDMKGDNQSDKPAGGQIGKFTVPNQIIEYSEATLKNNTREEMHEKLKKAYYDKVEEFKNQLEKLKETETAEEYEKIKEDYDEAMQRLGRIYNYQYEEIRKWYLKDQQQEEIRKAAKEESKPVETPEGEQQTGKRTITVRGKVPEDANYSEEIAQERAAQAALISAQQLLKGITPTAKDHNRIDSWDSQTKTYTITFTITEKK